MSHATTHTIYIGLGSNQGDARGHLQKALKKLGASQNLRVDAVSPFFCTQPQGFRDQEWFVNAVARLEVTPHLNPQDLLSLLSQIEQSMGRIRNQKWGPRIIDLDILLWDDLTYQTPNLIIPHPRICERAFVLIPLLYLNPDLSIAGKTPEQWLHLLTYSLENDVIRQN
ncbi:MAG: 2-amino-4-hydroxy-6-hydroxymethyldihydropteridine diphosphokinase [Desulfomicrobium sp.]|nr:2-amino-4-hydroxy-6-hydroxymethyldihydropteridine diphosphokinase [Desulfomicrobium sp.]NLV96494.1 2-amino-4-hydroxy-6-hydroxymethyldihydropteridine diphosphokinase [Desulfovibrionales bacterium]